MVAEEVQRQARAGKKLRLMFEDEGRFGRISDTRRCWAPGMIRPEAPSQIVREYSYAFAAVSPHDGQLDTLILPDADTAMMNLFLEEVSRRHAAEFILMFLDKAGWHRAKGLRIPPNIRLDWLPPYSPQCNPAEHIWDEAREKHFYNKVFNSLDGVETELEKALLELEQNSPQVASLCGFDWIVSIPLIAH